MPAVVSGVVLAACATTVVQSTRAGLVEFAGAQKEIFAKGKAKQALIVATMAASADSFDLGPVARSFRASPV